MTPARRKGSVTSADVLITGAAGFIGQRLSERLRDHGLNVIETDLMGRRRDACDGHYVASPGPRNLPQNKAQELPHLAAIVDDRGAANLFERVNVMDSKRLRAAMKARLNALSKYHPSLP